MLFRVTYNFWDLERGPFRPSYPVVPFLRMLHTTLAERVVGEGARRDRQAVQCIHVSVPLTEIPSKFFFSAYLREK